MVTKSFVKAKFSVNLLVSTSSGLCLYFVHILAWVQGHNSFNFITGLYWLHLSNANGWKKRKILSVFQILVHICSTFRSKITMKRTFIANSKQLVHLLVNITTELRMFVFTNLTKVRPLFTLSHRGSDNSRLLIVFSANNIDQSIGYFYVTESRLNDFVIFKNNALRLKYAIWLVEIMMQCNWK